MNLAIDVMGGDHAPTEIVNGVLLAREHFPKVNFILFGDENQISPLLSSKERIEIVHTEEKILATDEPVRAVKRKKNASMVLMSQWVTDGKADACISAGNTGALMAAGLFVVGRIDGIDRPALAPTLPTIDGKGFLMLDLGANVDAKPEHLLQYGIMGSVYAEKVRGIQNPRVGLLNIGTEEKKGTELTKQTYALLSEVDIHFVGNVESRDLLQGVADVVVTDGFTGNMVLKSIEGTAMSMFSMIKDVFTSSLKSKVAAGLVRNDLRAIKDKMDYTEYGGAGLFGLKAPVIKAHGSSNANAIFNAIKQAHEMVQYEVPATIKAAIDHHNQ
ncbi:phosphate acyltransferase PlsX [Bacillus sp. 2205SS5-2]|uniref:phosphate acyltransferase PlsX n=1 Tax=Bacillus sp. 2205SS5-2 TaxID=3109031 RepID=UPI003006FFBA